MSESADERKARLAQALRQNLRRRKTQARDMEPTPRDADTDDRTA